MGTFKGKRIIPKHDGVWNQKKEYEELTIVLDAESGDGYISRKPVPAGTVLSDTDYWSLCSHFNAQMYRLETDVAEDVEGMHKDLSETKASMSKEVSEAESRVNTKVSDAQSAMQKTEDAMNTAVEQMNKRLDANVAASTDSKADYAAELVDVRVGQDGTVYPSAGEAIRGQYSLAVENGITGAKLALAGSNGNLGEVFPKAAMPALLGAKCEAGEFLDYRITGTTDYGQFYHRFTNMLMGKFRKYLFISKIREISGSCAGVSCYQYDSKGTNLNTHVTKVVRVAHGNEIYVVFFGEILENAYRLDISPCVARNDAVVECDGRCVLLDVTGQSDDELQKVLSLISSSPVEDSILQYYDTWGIAGKVMSVPYADRTGISDQTREMLGNVAYGCPVFSEMIPFSSKFQEKDTMYAWAKAAVTRNEDWGVFGGVRLSGLAAGKYLVFGRVESVETDDTQLGEVSIGIIEPGIPNWAKRVPCGTLNKATLPFQMNLVYEYAGGKDNLNFAVQLTGSNYTSFVVTMWVLNVTGLSNEEIEALSHSSITERASAVKNATHAILTEKAEVAVKADHAEKAETAKKADHAVASDTAEKAVAAGYAELSGSWKGKKALVIGDSITAAGKWQKKLEELLGMNVATHAKGGIGILRMTDGDNGLDGTYNAETDKNGVLRPLTWKVSA